MAKLLLKYKADINDNEKRHGKTPLHIAIDKRQNDMIEFLLVNKADVNSEDERNWTPLHDVADSDNIAVAKLLLNHKAKINAKADGDGGATPVHIALRNGHKEMADFLRLHGGYDYSYPWKPIE